VGRRRAVVRQGPCVGDADAEALEDRDDVGEQRAAARPLHDRPDERSRTGGGGPQPNPVANRRGGHA
jgi:hypothetical protein